MEELTMEIWKEIENYEDCYEVSNYGRVRRKDGYVNSGIKHNDKRLIKGKVLKANIKRNGYLSVDLSKEYKVKTISIHRLVATAFCENDNPEVKTQVNHKNANKQDNRAENLEWVTPKENIAHVTENNLRKVVNRKKVRCKQLNMTFESSYAAAEFLNMKYFKNSKQVKSIAGKIRACTNGTQKMAYGFTWENCI